MKHRRKVIIVLVVLSAALYLLNVVHENLKTSSLKYQRFKEYIWPEFFCEHCSGSESSAADQCHFPELDPWDQSIQNYIKKSIEPIICPQVQPFLTFVDDNGKLNLNLSAIKELIPPDGSSKITCLYQYFYRGNSTDDNDIQFSPEKVLDQFNGPFQMEDDTLDVKCWKLLKTDLVIIDKSKPIYRNLHVHPIKKQHQVYGPHSDSKLSILLMFIDGVSYSAMQRRMPKTLKYVTEEMKMLMFPKMNKIAHNSYPNLMAVLTGLNVFSYQQKANIDDQRLKESRYANFSSFIWNKFKAKNYSTVFNEDGPKYGAFHYVAHGFAEKPVDFYYYQFWLLCSRILEESANLEPHCFRNTPNGKIHLDITRKHLVNFSNVLKFVVHFFMDYTNEEPHDPGYADDIYANFFQDMFSNGNFNNTAIIFMSDHGQRYDSIRQTLIGAMEEHNPFYGLYLPNWFYELYPNVKNNLISNMHRFTTTFDVHETIEDLVNQNFQGEQRPFGSRGLSQFYPIHENRTCIEAGVPDIFCLCYAEVSLPLDKFHAIFYTAASTLIQKLNQLLAPFQNICSIIKLKSINRVSEIIHSHGILDVAGSSTMVKLRMSVTAEPNDAIFEGIVIERFIAHWIVDGDIERLNVYRGTSECVKDHSLERYCTCKSVV